MGIEHPILGLMTVAIILVALVGAVSFLMIYYHNLQQAILAIPFTVGYAYCYSVSGDGNVTGVFVANNHRVGIYIVKVWVGTEKGILEVPVGSDGKGHLVSGDVEIEVWTQGFHEKTKLLQGQSGIVWVKVNSSSPLHLKGKTYTITLYFKVEGKDAYITQEVKIIPGETSSECS